MRHAVQRCIYNTVENLRWSIWEMQLTAKSRQKSPIVDIQLGSKYVSAVPHLR